MKRFLYFLSEGLAALIAGIAPGTIVLIGEITQAWERAYPIIRDVLHEKLAEPLRQTPIIPVELRRSRDCAAASP